MTWHNLGFGSWWRPHTNKRDAWHALQSNQGWNLRLVKDAADGPPFLNARHLEETPLLRDCKQLALLWEATP